MLDENFTSRLTMVKQGDISFIKGLNKIFQLRIKLGY